LKSIKKESAGLAEYNIFFFALLGMIFGSFGNVLISRIPKGESIVKPSSRCPNCKTSIKPYHNIPILSWLFLRGSCAYCGEKISYQYPLIELLSGLIFAAVYVKTGITIFALFMAFSFFLLLVLSTIDIEYKAVPDSINLPALIFALFSSAYLFENIQNAIFIAGAMALLRFFVSWIFKKEAMGEADIIVGATMGALLGVENTLFAIFAASLISLPFALYAKFKDKEPEIPFIPFLASGAFMVFVFGGLF